MKGVHLAVICRALGTGAVLVAAVFCVFKTFVAGESHNEYGPRGTVQYSKPADLEMGPHWLASESAARLENAVPRTTENPVPGDRIPIPFEQPTTTQIVRFDPQVVPCQLQEETRTDFPAAYGNAAVNESAAYEVADEGQTRWMLGVDRCSPRGSDREPNWNDQRMIPFESFAYGEYVGPFRTPHVSEYRLRIRDQVDFTFTQTREHLSQPYQIYAGDTLQIFSGADASLNQKDVVVLSDGTISVPLIGRVRAAGKTVDQLGTELNERYATYVKQPAMVVQVSKGDTPAADLINAVIARVGLGGQIFQAEVTPDGTVSLPLIGQVPAIGLTLRELEREVNARYGTRIRGLAITPVLRNRAPRSIYVLGQVARPGRITIDGPTSVMQAISMAEGWKTGSNLRQIIVFRRDQNWQLMATKIDLQGALLGKRPHPADEIWLRDSDIVLVPKTPIQRASETVELYMTRTIYSIFPQQGIVFNFDGFQTF